MISARFLLNRGRAKLDTDDLDALERAFDPPITLPARQTVIERGERVTRSTLLLEGVMCRFLDDQHGYRQLFGIHIAGDFFDLHAVPLEQLDHDVATITQATVATIPRERMLALCDERPHLARMMWYSTMLDAAMHREWIFRLGRLGAAARVAQFFAEMACRLQTAGVSDGTSAPLPINQADVAEACGLTAVHVNRVLRQLREDGLMTFRSGVIQIEDLRRLHRLAEFKPDYLYLEPDA